MGTLASLPVLLSWKTMAFYLLVFSLIVILDMFVRRHLLSHSVIYTITMLTAPIAALVAVGTPISPFLGALALSDNKKFIKAVVILAGSVLLFLLALIIYIRGHISPIDKTSEKFSSRPELFAARRLIKTGYAGTFIYGLITLVLAIENILIFVGVYKVTQEITEENPVDGVSTLLLIPLLLFGLLMFLNIFALMIFFFIGTEFVALGIAAVVTFLLNLLIVNGCIRYILTTDKTKGRKAIFIILSFIPAFNIVYGFICLRKISQELKNAVY